MYWAEIDEEARTVTFRGVSFGYGVGSRLALWSRLSVPGVGDLLILKKPHRRYFGGQSRPPASAPAMFSIYRVLSGVDGEYTEVDLLFEFPVRQEA